MSEAKSPTSFLPALIAEHNEYTRDHGTGDRNPLVIASLIVRAVAVRTLDKMSFHLGVIEANLSKNFRIGARLKPQMRRSGTDPRA